MFRMNLISVCLFAGVAALAWAEDPGHGEFKTNLSGYNEAPPVLTTGSGQVTVSVASDQKSLNVTLNFTKLPSVAQSAGLYFGTSGETGGLIASICGGGSKPACPTTADGNVTTTITATDVMAIPAQGLTAGDLASGIQAILNGSVYVNILDKQFPNGDIRGQLRRGFGPPVAAGGGRDQ